MSYIYCFDHFALIWANLCGLDDSQVIDAGKPRPHGGSQTGCPKRHPGAQPPPQFHHTPLSDQSQDLLPRLRILNKTKTIM